MGTKTIIYNIIMYQLILLTHVNLFLNNSFLRHIFKDYYVIGLSIVIQNVGIL